MNSMLFDVTAWTGVWTALVTPLKAGKGHALQLDRRSLERLVEAQIASGVRGLVIGGSTGEGSLLPTEVHQDLLVSARKIAGDRIPLVAGLGIGGTKSALETAERAKAAGYDGLLAAPPAYIKTPQPLLAKHFLEIGRVGLPVCLYDIPGRAAAPIDVGTFAELARSRAPEAKRLVAIKDATGNLQKALEIVEACAPGRYAMLSGDDLTYLPYLAAGGIGVISVASHVVPRALVGITDAFFKGQMARALELQSRYMPLFSALFWESNPIPVKHLLVARKQVANAAWAAPLGPMTPARLKALVALARSLPDVTE